MAYLHCHGHGCDWEQDDFWTKDGYNPFRQDMIDYLKDCLFKDSIQLDHCGEQRTLSGQELVARELERKARSIRGMKVKTTEDWKKVKDSWRCPDCGSKNWDID